MKVTRWTLAQGDSWKHLVSDKYIIVLISYYFAVLASLLFQTSSEQNQMLLFIIDKLSLSFVQRRSLNCLDLSQNSSY